MRTPLVRRETQDVVVQLLGRPVGGDADVDVLQVLKTLGGILIPGLLEGGLMGESGKRLPSTAIESTGTVPGI